MMNLTIDITFETGAVPVADTPQRFLTNICVSAPESGSDPANWAEWAPPVQMVIVLDTSVSMLADRKLDEAKRAIKTLTATLRDGRDSLGLVTFAGEAEIRANVCDGPLSPERRAAFLRALDAAESGPGTDLEQGLNCAYYTASGLAGTHRDNLFFLLFTDGGAMSGRTLPADLIFGTRPGDNAAALPDDFAIYTFGFGADQDARLLSELALKTRGVYYSMNCNAEIARAFANALAHIFLVVARRTEVVLEFLPGPGGKSAPLALHNVLDESLRLGRMRLGEKRNVLIMTRVEPVLETCTAERVPVLSARAIFAHGTSAPAVLALHFVPDDWITTRTLEKIPVRQFARLVTARALGRVLCLQDGTERAAEVMATKGSLLTTPMRNDPIVRAYISLLDRAGNAKPADYGRLHMERVSHLMQAPVLTQQELEINYCSQAHRNMVLRFMKRHL